MAFSVPRGQIIIDNFNYINLLISMPEKWREVRERYDALNLKKGTYPSDEFDYYRMPLIQKQTHNVKKLIPFARTPHNGYTHFFLDDYQFERVWNKPKKYLEKLKQYEGVLSPDFSLYTDYPIAVQIWNTYRNRWLGRYWQTQGMKVIPTAVWSTKDSYEFCFNGIEEESIVAVSSVGVLNDKNAVKLFKKGYKQLLDLINPEHIIFYGQWKDELEGNITFFNNYAIEYLRKLDGR